MIDIDMNSFNVLSHADCLVRQIILNFAELECYFDPCVLQYCLPESLQVIFGCRKAQPSQASQLFGQWKLLGPPTLFGVLYPQS